MSCNPAVGGTAKGHIVREIDAMGGIIGKIADATAIQYRMLNSSKGPAVWSPRAQSDKLAYQTAMKKKLEETPNLLHQTRNHRNLIVQDQKDRRRRNPRRDCLPGKTVDSLFRHFHARHDPYRNDNISRRTGRRQTLYWIFSQVWNTRI